MEIARPSLPVQTVECPRDAMQGWPCTIPTASKIDYLNSLLQVGFHTIDFGSFVSPKAIPQMADTKEVLNGLQLDDSVSKLLAIVANVRGAEEAVQFDQITYLGFPFSISETFQQRNANSSIKESLGRLEAIQELCMKHKKQLVVYMSMGFGNPYCDPYNAEILLDWTDQIIRREVGIISLADTVGLASPKQVKEALISLIPNYPTTTFGVHLHSTSENWKEKMAAAYDAGCRRFDGALKGIGGCPMADNALVGNMDTEHILSFLDEKGISTTIDKSQLARSLQLASTVFTPC